MFLMQKLTSLLRGHLSSRIICTQVFNMEKAYLRHNPETEKFDISFQYINPELRVNRRFNFTRSLQEPISVFLSRVSGNIEKEVNKKNKRKKSKEENDAGLASIETYLMQNNDKIDNDMLCKDVFKDENNVTLRILENSYKVIINSPFVDSISLPKSILANFPVYPSKFEAIYTDKKLCSFKWFVSKDRKNWTEVGDDFLYVPKNADIGAFIKLAVTPRNENHEGPVIEEISNCTIDASPGICPFEDRHKYTTEKCKNDEFRVVTYNILADLYCDSDFVRTQWYPYCPPYALNIDYRKQLIIKELLGYNSDIICLQEVDKKVYTYDLDPLLSVLNYESVFSLKGGQVAEGLACFFNKTRFEILEENSIVLAEEIEKRPIFNEIASKIAENEKLKERVLQRTTAVQYAALKSIETGNILLVANTHLYFHPDSDNIRLIQGALCVRYIEDAYKKIKEKYDSDKVSIIFCGDFNSVPECGIYQLYTNGYLPGNFIDYESNKEEIITGLELKQPFKLSSACGTPKYTNFTAGFQGCLDYIYYDMEKLSVVKSVPLPTIEQLNENTALPSIVFPSDHISLIADLKFL